MEFPTVLEPQAVGRDTHVVTTYLPVPGLGILPANAFLIRSAEPVLVDCGVEALGDAAFDRIVELIDPGELRYIWLTHTDRDHTGCLARLLEAAPDAKLVTTFLGMGKLGLSEPLDPARIHLLNPGQSLDVGDRSLIAVRPPTFDAPETTALFDTKSQVLFSADSFGAVLPEVFENARAIATRTLAEGLSTWAQVDAPWLSWISQRSFDLSMRAVREFKPSLVLSSHLPPAPGMFEELAAMLGAARDAAPFVGPDQKALVEMMMAG